MWMPSEYNDKLHLHSLDFSYLLFVKLKANHAKRANRHTLGSLGKPARPYEAPCIQCKLQNLLT
jgi:hypothetical protein